MDNRPIFLIGMRGSGKTSVGQALAKRLGWAFMDTDALVETECGCSITELVEREGWEVFRALESKALHKCTHEKTVVATGGGIILAKQNRDFLQNYGPVFFLSVPLDILIKRIANDDDKRPALTSEGTLHEVETILNERLLLYEGTAHFEVDASLSINDIVDKIMTFIRSRRREVCKWK